MKKARISFCVNLPVTLYLDVKVNDDGDVEITDVQETNLAQGYDVSSVTEQMSEADFAELDRVAHKAVGFKPEA